jgi:predicted secreted protein
MGAVTTLGRLVLAVLVALAVEAREARLQLLLVFLDKETLAALAVLIVGAGTAEVALERRVKAGQK